jgi:hypothetical protein
MRRFSLLACLATVAFAQDDTGAISGVVLDSVSHSPIKRAQIGLNLNSFANTGRPGPVPQRGFEGRSATTGPNGEFSFPGLPAGSYSLWANHPRYPPVMGRPPQQRVDVGAGGEPAKVTIELIPGGSISGRVVDEDGDPITGCFPQLRPAKNSRMGIPMTGAEPSNEDGEYRIYGLPAGKYVLAIQCHRPVFQPRPLSPDPNPPPSLAYMPQFYPLSADRKGAEILDLGPGVDKSGVDFRLSPTPVVSIRGSVKVQGTAQRVENANIMLLAQDEGRRAFFGNAGANFDVTKGTFEFQSVLPGSYILSAFTYRTSEQDPKPQYGARRTVQVTDQPVEADIDLQPAFDMTGTVEFEGERKPETQIPQVNLMPVEEASGGSGSAQTQADGSFSIKAVMPGLWKIQVFVGQGGFVKSVLAGGRELPDGLIDTTAGPIGPVRVLISTKTGSIRGSGPPGRTVAVASAGGDDRFQQHYGAMIDAAGEFTVQGLAPGKYRIMLADPGSPEIWSEDDRTVVTVTEGETAAVDLTESK